MNTVQFKQELLRSTVYTQNLYRKLITPICQRHDLTPQQLFVLGNLSQKNDQSPRQLSDQIGVNPSNFATVIKKMESRGLVQRVGCQGDKRMSVLHLTEEGKNLLTSMEHENDERYGAVFAHIPETLFTRICDGLDAFQELSLRL